MECVRPLDFVSCPHKSLARPASETSGPGSLGPRRPVKPTPTTASGCPAALRYRCFSEACTCTPSRSNEYDGVLEYWVCIRETGKHTTGVEEQEVTRSREKASCALYTKASLYIADVCTLCARLIPKSRSSPAPSSQPRPSRRDRYQAAPLG